MEHLKRVIMGDEGLAWVHEIALLWQKHERCPFKRGQRLCVLPKGHARFDEYRIHLLRFNDGVYEQLEEYKKLVASTVLGETLL